MSVLNIKRKWSFSNVHVGTAERKLMWWIYLSIEEISKVVIICLAVGFEPQSVLWETVRSLFFTRPQIQGLENPFKLYNIPRITLSPGMPAAPSAALSSECQRLSDSKTCNINTKSTSFLPLNWWNRWHNLLKKLLTRIFHWITECHLQLRNLTLNFESPNVKNSCLDNILSNPRTTHGLLHQLVNIR